ncbi:MAG: hypothetical protein V1716_04285 [Candidatus Uhrbacteria bacterium]
MSRHNRSRTPDTSVRAPDVVSAPAETPEERLERLNKRALDAMRARIERQRRESEVESLAPAARAEARAAAVREARASEAVRNTVEIRVRTVDGREPVVGKEARIFVKSLTDRAVNLLSILPGANDETRPIKIIFGTKLEMDPNTKEREPRVIKIPVDVGSEDLPFIIREITRAIHDNETKIISVAKKDGGFEDRPSQTAEGVMIHKELVARKKLVQGLEKIKDDYDRVDLRILRSRYEDLEKEHSLASRTAELVIDKLVEDEFKRVEATTGKSLFVDYGGREGFRRQKELFTLIREAELVHLFDKNGNRILLGRPEVDVDKIQPISAGSFFSGRYALNRIRFGSGWDVSLAKGRIGAAIRDSEVVKDAILLGKIHEIPKDTGPLEDKEVLKKMASEHWKAPLVLPLVAVELGLKPIRFATKKARHGLSQGLWDLNKLTGQLMLGKKWEPKWETEAKLDKKADETYKKLKEKALGKMA